SSVTVPSGATSLTRTLTTASLAVVVTQTSAKTGPEKRRFWESGAVVYWTPSVASSSRSSVVQGAAASKPADHWLVDWVQIPETGFWMKVSPDVSAVAGLVGFAGVSVFPALT